MKNRYILNFEKILLTQEKPKIVLVIVADGRCGTYITTETEFKKLGDALECLNILNKLRGEHNLEKYESICTIEEGHFLELINLPHYLDRICHTLVDVNLYLYDTDGCRYQYILKEGRSWSHYNSELDKEF